MIVASQSWSHDSRTLQLSRSSSAQHILRRSNPTGLSNANLEQATMSSASSSQPNPSTESPSHSGLVSIGTHKLWLSIFGPPYRQDNTGSTNKPIPNELVIVFAGAGDVHLSWEPVRNILQGSSQFPESEPNSQIRPRILVYDRSGLGSSERGPNRLFATNAASELLAALQSTGLIDYHKSLILVAHSYGAIVAREFLHLLESGMSSSSESAHVVPQKNSPPILDKPKNAMIKAMVLVDPSTENQHLYFQHPNPDISALLGNLNFARVTGLREKSKLNGEEWRARAIILSTPSTMAASAEEVSNYVEVCTSLGEKRQLQLHALGNRPLVILCAETWKEYEAIYKAGVEVGNGTSEERQRFRELLDNWEGWDRKLKEELLGLVTSSGPVTANAGVDVPAIEPLRVTYDGESVKLEESLEEDEIAGRRDQKGDSRGSKRCKMVLVKDCGHNIQLIRPEVVVREILWVLDIVRHGNLKSM